MKDRLRNIKTSFLFGPAALCMIIFLLDQISKIATVATKPMPFDSVYTSHNEQPIFIAGETLHIVFRNVFHLVDFRNPGAAWGIFGEHTPVLAIISLLAFLYLLYDFHALCGQSKFKRYTIALLMGGIIGNFIDRGFREGGVVDMFQVYIPVPQFASEWVNGIYYIDGIYRYIFPAFNIADSAICVATASLLIASFFIKDEEEASESLESKN